MTWRMALQNLGALIRECTNRDDVNLPSSLSVPSPCDTGACAVSLALLPGRVWGGGSTDKPRPRRVFAALQSIVSDSETLQADLHIPTDFLCFVSFSRVLLVLICGGFWKLPTLHSLWRAVANNPLVSWFLVELGVGLEMCIDSFYKLGVSPLGW